MIDSYLIASGIAAMVASYIAIMHWILSHAERRDLEALGELQPKHASPKVEATAAQVSNALPAHS